MPKTAASDSVLLDELLAEAEPGTTAEQLLVKLADVAKLNIFAARGIVAGLDQDDIGDDIHEGLTHVLERASTAVLDLVEVLSDGVKLSGREAHHG